MRIRTVLVGFGWSGREIWLPRLMASSDYEVVAAVDPDPVKREAFTAATDRPSFDGVDALRAEDADLALVASPNHLHAAIARRLLGRGLATFVEKPVCLTSAEADTLAEAERAGGGRLLAGSAFRCRADVRELTALAGELGHLRHIDLVWERARGVPRSQGWFTSRAEAGGGVLFDLGWHLLDVLETITGPVAFDQVVASTSHDHVNDPRWTAAWRHDQPVPELDADVEDTVRGFLVTRSGLSVGLRASWAAHSASHDVTEIRVDGSAGSATLRTTFGFSPNREPRPRLSVVRRGRTSEVAVPAEPIGTEYTRQLDDLRDRLADPSARGSAIAGVRRIVGTIEALYAASATPLLPAGPVTAAAAT
ncbi:oxidoreductase [Amycolatopsis sp. WAC 01375]|uniref:Gfo/Idh/MocA family protein n=1 Tax=unclassified Amycolatopsis TaxID=2618356 RepID=UPI000F79EDF5|nr:MULTISPECIES: Gfo/Idh/MocA family oxidoreductase [unclassified Amycolatopsis]RSM75231.1 oxidoreductase [Amycolatopsis sp. WAC 01375]RSN35596.1 oxidoreductase [Amycolatopsis sp. WAC 01416]